MRPTWWATLKATQWATGLIDAHMLPSPKHCTRERNISLRPTEAHLLSVNHDPCCVVKRRKSDDEILHPGSLRPLWALADLAAWVVPSLAGPPLRWITTAAGCTAHSRRCITSRSRIDGETLPSIRPTLLLSPSAAPLLALNDAPRSPRTTSPPPTFGEQRG